MTIQYKQTNPQKSKEMIDDLIDTHTIESFPEIDTIPRATYAVTAYDESTQEFAGGISLRCEFDTAHITGLAVSPAYRGRQIGENLLQEAEELLQDKNIRILTLSTLSYQALGFYQKFGYKVYGVVEDYPKIGVTKYHLKKEL